MPVQAARRDAYTQYLQGSRVKPVSFRVEDSDEQPCASVTHSATRTDPLSVRNFRQGWVKAVDVV